MSFINAINLVNTILFQFSLLHTIFLDQISLYLIYNSMYVKFFVLFFVFIDFNNNKSVR